MLKERQIGQKRGEPRRRLFSDRMFYLFVWYRPPEAVWGFQLIYRLPERPLLMATWTPRPPGWVHHFLSEGARGDAGYGTGSDMAAIDGSLFDKRGLLEHFGRAGASLGTDVRDFITSKIESHPDRWEPCRHCDGDRPASERCARCGTRACAECAAMRPARVPSCGAPLHGWVSQFR